MSIFSKQTQWTEYLNSLLQKDNPFQNRKKTDDSLLLAEEEKVDEVKEAKEEEKAAKEENDLLLEQLESAANDRVTTGDAEKEKTTAKSNALYELLLDFTKQQQSRYNDLIDEIKSGSYLDSEGAQSILASYEKQGQLAAGHALAEAAGTNGGNPDTYAAAQGNRQRLAFLDAGHAEAQSYYGEQLERLLSAVRASSSDMGDLYGAVEKNISEAGDRADSDLSIGADLLKILSDQRAAREERAAKALDKAKEDAKEASAISPMEIDAAYTALLAEKENGRAKYTPAQALTVLWQQYPSMHSYIQEKYKKVLSPSYTFEE